MGGREEMDVDLKSVHEEAFLEAERHCKQAGQRLDGEVVSDLILNWYRRNFLRFCRHRRLEHLEGTQAYREFDSCYFGILGRLAAESDADGVVPWVLDRFRSGSENLDIIHGALEKSLPIEPVLLILEQINANEARLEARNPVDMRL